MSVSKKTWKMTFTPRKSLMSFEYTDERTIPMMLAQAIRQRTKDGTRELTLKEDGEWLRGVQVFCGTNCPNRILAMLEESDSVAVDVDLINEEHPKAGL